MIAAVIELETDIAIVGAGFSGSLLSLLLKQIGLRSVLIDRGSHPRFAIGESSTPIANFLLADLARRYNLPQLIPLATYGSWKRAYPEIVCGLKRGFSYYHHTIGQQFQPRADHANELLVAASEGIEDADTHWLRSDFDQFLAQEAVRADIPYFDQTNIEQVHANNGGWNLIGSRLGEAMTLQADLLIDASGDGGLLSKQLGIDNHPAGLQTHSRSLFSHFRNVRRWHDLYQSWGGDTSDHPYPCDDSALHHVFKGGWMWVLPFDNGITSAGFSLDPNLFPLDRAVSPEAEWAGIMQLLPSVAEQFCDAEPTVAWRQTGRIQRRLQRSAGPNWVMLPTAAAFLDPFFSTGNSFTLVGIGRLMAMLERSWNRPDWSDQMQVYDRQLQQEAEILDLIVNGCFRGFGDFERTGAMSMFYFIAATWSESEQRAGRLGRGGAFLCADQVDFKKALIRAVAEVDNPSISTREFVGRVHSALAPFNRVGLCDPAKRNMYDFVP